jgi:hypothetical protein
MNTYTNTITAAEVRNLNLNAKDVLSFDHLNGAHLITVNGTPAMSFANAADRAKSKAKIQRMGFALGTTENDLGEVETGVLTGKGSYATVISR